MIVSTSWDSFYKTYDPNGALSEFCKIYNDACNRCFPLKRLSIKRLKDKNG